MRKILVKIHQAFGKGCCIGIGVIFLMFSFCFMGICTFQPLPGIDDGLDTLFAFALVLCLFVAIIMFISSCDDYETLELPWYYTYDKYGRYIKTNGKETVVLKKAKAKKTTIELGIETEEDAKAVLQHIEDLYKGKIICGEEYSRTKRQLAEFLKKET